MRRLAGADLRDARHAWEVGGSMGLGLWAAAWCRRTGTPWSAATYGAIVRQVREGERT